MKVEKKLLNLLYLYILSFQIFFFFLWCINMLTSTLITDLIYTTRQISWFERSLERLHSKGHSTSFPIIIRGNSGQAVPSMVLYGLFELLRALQIGILQKKRVAINFKAKIRFTAQKSNKSSN